MTISSGSCLVNFSSVGCVSMLFSACTAIEPGMQVAHSSDLWTSSCRLPSTTEGMWCILRYHCFWYLIFWSSFVLLPLNLLLTIFSYTEVQSSVWWNPVMNTCKLWGFYSLNEKRHTENKFEGSCVDLAVEFGLENFMDTLLCLFFRMS